MDRDSRLRSGRHQVRRSRIVASPGNWERDKASTSFRTCCRRTPTSAAVRVQRHDALARSRRFAPPTRPIDRASASTPSRTRKRSRTARSSGRWRSSRTRWPSRRRERGACDQERTVRGGRQGPHRIDHKGERQVNGQGERWSHRSGTPRPRLRARPERADCVDAAGGGRRHEREAGARRGGGVRRAEIVRRP